MGKNTFWQYHDTVPSGRLGRLDALCAISRILSVGTPREDALCRVLDVLDRDLGLRRGTITLLAPDGKEVRIEAVHDLSEEKSQTITYRIGEGVTGKVMETGKAAIVERVSREPLFLNRFERWNVTKEEVSFICVPLFAGDEVIGTISVDRPFDENAPLDEEVRILRIVASMIANHLGARRQAAIERQGLVDDNLRLRQELGDKFRPENIIGNSKAMRRVYGQIQQVAGGDTTVLICGESGTGKELIARSIHYSSPRSAGPFVKVNCAGVNGDLLEKEVFGYDRGAFDGAIETRKGRLEEANGGTLFLGEVGDFSPPTQIKLLRVLRQGRFERLGGHLTVKTNARIIAATSRDLEKAVHEGSFQRDLYDQINVFQVLLPPLRQRKDDVLLLADYFVEQYSKKMDKNVRRISGAAMNMIAAYHWPGNVRELENCIERAVRLTTDGALHEHHLSPAIQTPDASEAAGGGSFKDRIALFERAIIVEALKRCNGNVAAAARELKATPRIIRYRVRELGIDCRQYCKRRG